MKLQDRNLGLQMRGDDVKLLQAELRRLGYTIGDDELVPRRFGKSTRRAVLELQKAHGLETTGVVDEATAGLIGEAIAALSAKPENGPTPKPETEPDGKPKSFVVRGHVRLTDGTPLSGVVVQAFDKDLPSLRPDGAPGEELGKPAVTDKDGAYQIGYTADQISRHERASADLVVRAVDGEDRGDATLAESSVWFNAPAVAEVDLVVAAGRQRGPSEYDRLVAAIKPLIGDLQIADLTAADVEFLAGETGLDRGLIDLLVTASRHARLTEQALAPVGPPYQDVPTFYGCLREELPADLFALLNQDTKTLRAALGAAIEAGIVPASRADDLDAIVQRLQQLRVVLALQPPGQDRPSPLSQILATALPTTEQQAALLLRYHGHDGPTEQFWKELGEDSSFGADGLVDKIQLALQLGVVTDGHGPFVQHLQERRAPASMHDLIDLDLTAWRTLIAEVDPKAEQVPAFVAGQTAEERIDNYARRIVGTLEAAFPMAYLARGLAQQPTVDMALVKSVLALNPNLDMTRPLPAQLEWGDLPPGDREKGRAAVAALQGELAMFPGLHLEDLLATPDTFKNPIRDAVQRALTNAPDLDLGGHNLTEYVEAQGGTLFAGIDAALHGPVTDQLRAMQRVYRLSPRFADIAPLMRDGLDSAQAIAYQPTADFRRQFSAELGGDFRADLIHERAVLIADDAAVAFGAAAALNTSVVPFVVGPPRVDPRVRATYADLFGRVSLCACEECRSVYSPAAYLVDLLHFLERPAWYLSPLGPMKPLTALQRRRPDLLHLPLTCENTNTLIPYIDLVNEILETYVAYSHLPDAPIGADERGATSAELLASPRYVHAAAYDALKREIYPLRLPFNLDLEIVRAYLEELGTSRHALMRAFQRIDPPSEAVRAEIAVEYLKLSPEDASLLSGVPARPVFELYGYTATQTTWADELATLPTFLERTGIEYADLTAILWTRFVNPDGPAVADAVGVQIAGDACDLAARRLRQVSGAALSADQWSRLNRYIRLWRRLGWAVQDVDRALHALGAGDGVTDLPFLRRLGEAVRLKEELDLPLDETLSLWSPIDTHGDSAEHPRAGSLYARLFLSRSARGLACRPDAFELTADGTDLATAGQVLSSEARAIRAALRVSAAELAALREVVDRPSTPPDDRSAPLSLASLSDLHRYAVLARALGWPIRDLLALRQLSGVEPFVPTPAAIEADPSLTPQDATARFVALARTVQRSGFSIPLLEYLLLDRADAARSPSLDEATLVAHLTALRSRLRQAETATEPGELPGPERFERAAIQAAAEALGLETSAVRALVRTLRSREVADEPLVADLLALRPPAPGTRPPGAPEPPPDRSRQAYTLLHKIARLIDAANLAPEEVVHLAGRPAGFDGFDFGALPVGGPRSPDDASRRAFTAWERLTRYVAVRDALSRGADLIRALTVSTPADARQALLTATDWSEADLDSALGPGGLNVTDLNAFVRDPVQLDRLVTYLSSARRAGVAPARLFAWAAEPPTAARAAEIQSAVKARSDEQRWLTVSKSLNDGLRARRRDALVAYILVLLQRQGRSIATTEELFEHFLIDVEMEPCMATSRIKQAISSVQLFVQRCFMNLERELVPPGTLPANQWAWMRSYRVWEANRKIFLYPENWIEPELRDDKSPFFEDLENELLQNDVTDATAESAFLGYLEKLDEVARLDVRGVYWEVEPARTWDRPTVDERDRVDVLHVFGRTRGAPPAYYYRRLIARTTWTPWERAQVDVEGDHLLPVVVNRRLYLFWPIFREITLAGAEHPGGSGSPPHQQQLEIGLAWSEYANGRWSPKRVAAAKLVTRFVPGNERRNIWFDSADDAEGLTIRCQLVELPGYASRSVSRLGSFSLNLCTGDVRAYPGGPAVWPAFPAESEIDGQMFVSRPVSLTMTLFDEVRRQLPVLNSIQSSERPGYEQYRLVYPHQYPRYVLQAPCFFQDDRATYLVTPELLTDRVEQVANPYMVQVLSAVWVTSAMTGRSRQTSPLPPGVGVVSDSIALESTNPGAVHWATSIVCADSWLTGSTTADDRPANQRFGLRFHTFYHPYVCDLVKALKRRGVTGLLALESQRRSDLTADGSASADQRRSWFHRRYTPSTLVDPRYPAEDVDFDGGAYALYNWELFFHAPFLLARRLSANQRFEEAQRWLHFIFDPTTDSTDPIPQRYWKTLPFYENSRAPHDQVSDLLALLSYTGGDPQLRERRARVEAAIARWRDDPFNPHAVARTRITAYQKAVVMAYIDNLIGWGDRLFRQDTIESINQATQLYVLAALMLGKRPTTIPPPTRPAPRTYQQLRPHLDAFSNALVATENAITGRRCTTLAARPSNGRAAAPTIGSLYFCVPPNDRLLGYWDRVEDRLFKIRHCLNIEGVARQLPLFEPPIDPALLVRARAAGVDLGTVLDDSRAPTPPYRFSFVLQRAVELCSEVRSMASVLLAALERRDAEDLALLRSSHEIRLLDEVRRVRQRQLDEADATIVGLQRSRSVVEGRQQFYAGLARVRASQTATAETIDVGVPVNSYERESLAALRQANDEQIAAGVFELFASVLHVIPNWTGPAATFGGSNLGSAANAFARYFSTNAADHTYQGSRAATVGGYDRRAQEWRFQADQAARELEQIDAQLAAARIREEIARLELRNHELQIEQARAVDDLIRSRKLTSKQLYDWMSAQLAAVYFQAYQLAYDLAKRAERAYRFERGLTTSSFVRFGQWDSLRRGLLAGEQLQLDLRRLEAAYLEQNEREYEITKHVSLVLHDPLALISLKTTGQCIVRLPEALFDADYPGHYMRRIKGVGLTVPAVVGPYTGVNCTLTLLSNKTRVASSPNIPYPESVTSPDDRFHREFAAVPSVATSHAQNDTGLFELNFRDERYLPFEGAGVISEWRIELPPDTNAFDLNTISDLVLRVSYTARDGGDGLRGAARTALGLGPGPGRPGPMTPPSGEAERHRRQFSLRHEYSVEWFQFLQSAAPQTFRFELTPERFPFQLRGRTIRIQEIDVFVVPRAGTTLGAIDLAVTPPTLSIQRASTRQDPRFGAIQHATIPAPATDGTGGGLNAPLAAPSGAPDGDSWSLAIQRPSSLGADQLQDILLVLSFDAS